MLVKPHLRNARFPSKTLTPLSSKTRYLSAYHCPSATRIESNAVPNVGKLNHSRFPTLPNHLQICHPKRSLSSVPTNGKSHVVGPKTPPLFQQTLGSFFNDQVSKYGDKPALIVKHEASRDPNSNDCIRWSYNEFDEQVDRLANSLVKIGIKKGDRVGAFMLNSSAYATLQWATAKIGAIMACINPAARVSELVDILNMVECKALFCVPQIRKSNYASSLIEALPHISTCQPNNITDPAVPSLRSVIMVNNISDNSESGAFSDILSTAPGITNYNDLVKEPISKADREHIQMRTNETDQHDCINMQFTSGTTGLPKAVALTHHNILNNGFFIGECMKLTSNDILCNPPPLFHCFGLVLGNLATWTHGGCIVYASESFDPVAVLRTVSEEKCTALHGVPTMFIAELALLDKLKAGEHVEGLSGIDLDISNLRTGIAAGSPVPDEIMRQVMANLNLTELTISYGMTETSPVTFMTRTDDPVIKRTNTVGKIKPHVEAKIVEPDDTHGDPLPLNTPGELLVSGYPLQLGYWNNKKETDKVMFYDDKGVRWMRTGDAGIMDEDGYLTIVGRYKDIIIRGGENLHPVVIENHILTMDAVDDASVIAVKDELFGEVVGVFIQRKQNQLGQDLTAEAICKYVADKKPQAKPSWVWFLGEEGVPDAYPKTLSGKIRKVDLREWAEGLVEKGIGKQSNGNGNGNRFAK